MSIEQIENLLAYYMNLLNEMCQLLYDLFGEVCVI